jgi:hypothetical protein
MNKRIGAFMQKIKYQAYEYLWAATCKGRRGVVVGTNTKDLEERAEKYFFPSNETKN